MILIVNIPDEEYKTLSELSEKEKINELSYYERIIANGTPYDERIQGDLISREALKRVIKIECNPYGAPTIDYESGKRVLTLIDRTPAIKPCDNCDLYFKAMTKEEMQKGSAV